MDNLMVTVGKRSTITQAPAKKTVIYKAQSDTVFNASSGISNAAE